MISSRLAREFVARLRKSSRAAKITVALGLLYSTFIGFLPLFGTLGYEQSLAAGLFFPAAAAIWTALDASAREELSPGDAVTGGILRGASLGVLALVVSLLHTARSGSCDLFAGVSYYLLTAFAGIVMGGVWGAVVSEVARRARRRRVVAWALALLGPIASAATSVLRFRSSPMIFAYDSFVGYFSGTLYDTIIEPGQALTTYRVGSLATVTAVLALATSLQRRGRWYGLRPETRARQVLFVLAAGVSLYVTARGQALGHHSTADSIEETLGARKNGARCDIVYPSTVSDSDAALLLRDCEEDLRDVEDALGARGPEKVTAFFFRDPAQKRVLMGAEHTYIAKPWRKEVYLQVSGYPHPVLAHELAHVVSGNFGSGPFHVGGGLIPNPGLIEGIAVAAAPDDDVLTDDEWARAMKDAKILPPMRTIFSLAFLSGSSAKSYTLAGSFVRFMMTAHGKDKVRAWYGGEDISVLTGKSWDDLEAEYLRFLDGIVLRPEAIRVAEARFGRPGLFGRTCPHVVDELRRDADQCRDSHDFARARALYDKALAYDKQDLGTRYAKGQMLARWVKEDEGRPMLVALADDEKVPSSFRDRAEEALGDLDLLRARPDAAVHYGRAHARSLDEDFLRTLDVKTLAAQDPDIRLQVVAMLVGDESHTPDPFVFGVELARGETRKDSALGHYLIARQMASRARHDDVLRELDRAKAAGAYPVQSVAREALRMEAVSACATANRARIDALRPLAEATLAGGRKDSVLRLLARCAK